MDKRPAAAAAILAALIAAPVPAAAQTKCMPRDNLVKMLADRYQEHRRIYAFASPMQMLEMFTSDSGSWTALISRPDGVSCIVAAGTDWNEVDLPESGEPM